MKIVKYDVSNGVQRQQIKVKKIIVGAVASIGLLGAAAIPAMAAPSGLTPNTAPQQSSKSNNCIAYYSAQWEHNGQATTLGQGGDPSHGTRGDEIKALQDSCGAQQ